MYERACTSIYNYTSRIASGSWEGVANENAGKSAIDQFGKCITLSPIYYLQASARATGILEFPTRCERAATFVVLAGRRAKADSVVIVVVDYLSRLSVYLSNRETLGYAGAELSEFQK